MEVDDYPSNNFTSFVKDFPLSEYEMALSFGIKYAREKGTVLVNYYSEKGGDIEKSQRSGDTEWWGELPEKIKRFDNAAKAKYRADKLNVELQAHEPKWAVYNTPPMPIMLKRVFV